jgi:hypothetical protein
LNATLSELRLLRQITTSVFTTPILTIPGRAFAPTEIDAAVQEAFYWAYQRRERDGTDGCTNVYLCMGAQEKPGTKENQRYPKANRKEYNIKFLRCLYIDTDVDTEIIGKTGEFKKENAYRSVPEMDAGIEELYKITNLPRAAMAVNSGRGGRHLYWPLTEPVAADEWQPWADALAKAAIAAGLKFDSGCTVDRSRVLRIPKTFNYKPKSTDEPPDAPWPRPVTLEYDTGQNFTLDELKQALTPYLSQSTTSKTMPSFIERMKEPRLQQSKLANDDDWDDLGAGVEDRKWLPNNIEQVALACPHIATVLKTGGAASGEPLWFLHIQIAHYCESREETAHRLSKGHDDYEPTETDEKLSQVAESRGGGKYGPPYCETFQKYGAVECLNCRHWPPPGRNNHRLAFPARYRLFPPSGMRMAVINQYAEVSMTQTRKILIGSTNAIALLMWGKTLFRTKIEGRKGYRYE